MTEDQQAPEKPKTPVWKRVVQALISLAIVVGIFAGVMPLIADYGDVFDTIRAMTSLEIGSLLVVGLWNLATYWFVLVAALPGLRLREAAVVNQASTAVSNTLPAGGAIGVGVSIGVASAENLIGYQANGQDDAPGGYNQEIAEQAGGLRCPCNNRLHCP